MQTPHLSLAVAILLPPAICVACARYPVPPPRAALAAPPEYSLTVVLVPHARRLEVSGTVRLASTDTARSEIVLSMSRRMGDFSVHVVEPASDSGEVDLRRLSEDDADATWAVRFSKPVPPGEPIVLRFSAIGDGEAASLYYVGPEVAFASAWGTHWYPFPAGGIEKGSGTITVLAPTGWSVATGGVRRSTDAQEAEGTFQSAILQPTYFSFTAGPYSVVQQAGRVSLSAYMLNPRDHSGTYLQGVSTMVDVLTNEFGPLAFPALTIVEVPRELATQAGFNAFSAAGLLVLNSRAFEAPDPKYLLEWLGHELSHQWFPHAVDLRTPPGRYMVEALAEYGGLRVVEEIGGAAAAKQLRMSGFEYDPIYSALEYFRLVGAGVDQPLNDLQPRLEHRNLAYTKGALVFDMLSRELGRAAFQRILRDMTQTYRAQQLTWQEFLDAIEHGAGKPLDWFYEQWFQRTGAPDFHLSWNQEGDTLRGSVTQSQPIYVARLKMLVRGETDSQVHMVESTGASIGFAVPVAFHVNSVELDPDFEVLRWTPEYRAAAESVRFSRPRAHVRIVR